MILSLLDLFVVGARCIQKYSHKQKVDCHAALPLEFSSSCIVGLQPLSLPSSSGRVIYAKTWTD